MATVQQVLDKLATGKMSLPDAVADFRARKWGPARPTTSLAQAYGVVDTEPRTDDWGLVESDSRLTPGQYSALARARR